MNLAILGACALAVYLGLCITSTLRVWRSAYYDRPQKWAQTALLWLLPIAGLVMVRYALLPAQLIGHGDADGFFAPLWTAARAVQPPSLHADGMGMSIGTHGHCDAGGHAHAGACMDAGSGGAFGGYDGGGGTCN